jgi:hypothetical protein
MADLQKLFSERGLNLDAEAIARAVEHALKVSGIPPYSDPAQYFSEEQLATLAEGGLDLSHAPFGIEDPVLMGAFEYAVLRATALSTSKAAERLNVNDSRIRQRLASRSLYGIKVDNEWLLPEFQFSGKDLVPGIDRVIPHLDAGLSPVAVFHWFLSPNPDLEIAASKIVSPRDWLMLGYKADAVIELASFL